MKQVTANGEVNHVSLSLRLTLIDLFQSRTSTSTFIPALPSPTHPHGEHNALVVHSSALSSSTFTRFLQRRTRTKAQILVFSTTSLINFAADLHFQNHHALLQTSPSLRHHRYHGRSHSCWSDRLRHMSRRMLYSCGRVLFCSRRCVGYSARGGRTACCGVLQYRLWLLLYCLRRRLLGPNTVNLASWWYGNESNVVSTGILESRKRVCAFKSTFGASNEALAVQLRFSIFCISHPL